MSGEIGSDDPAPKGPVDWRAGSEDGRRAGQEAQQEARTATELRCLQQHTCIPGPQSHTASVPPFIGGLLDTQAVTTHRQPQREFLEAWESWLRSFRWDFFVTGTWEEPVRTDTALHTVQSWLGKHRGAYAAVGLQRGPVSQTIHVHALVGGAALSETSLRRSWVRSGHVLVSVYHHSQGGVEYLVRQASSIELIGSPIPYRPRVRGRRG